MALYFLRKEGTPGRSKHEKSSFQAATWVSYVTALLIAASSFIAATGRDNFSHFLASSLLPSRFIPPSPKVILLAMDRDPGGFDSLDVAMALRGLAKLRPSQIIINGSISSKSDSPTLLDGVRQRVRNDGIGLIEGTAETPAALWRPLALALYNPPLSWHSESQLPRIAGQSVAEGKSSFLPPAQGITSASIPLLASTDSGEIAGSIWWEAIKPRKMTGPTWLLGGRMLLFPNHFPLMISAGGIKNYSSTSATVVPMDLFLLRIEEKERGTFSPDFEALWDQATVILGSPDDVQVTGSLQILLRGISFGRLSLVNQALLAFLLIALSWGTRRLSGKKSLFIGMALLLATLGTGAVAIHHGILLPLLPPLIASFSIIVSRIPFLRITTG